MATKSTTGPKPGSAQSANAKRKQLDANIRQIFEEEARRGDALRNAIRYMFENDPVIAAHAYIKLLATKTVSNPVTNVTNIRAEQINAAGVIHHMEELVRLTETTNNASLVPHEPALLVDDSSETH